MTRKKRQITIFIENFFERRTLKDLPSIIVRATAQIIPQTLMAVIHATLQVKPDDVGQFYFHRDQISSSGKTEWILFQPVHVSLSMADVSFIAPEHLDITTDEVTQLISTLAADADCQWQSHRPGRWFCCTNEKPEFTIEQFDSCCSYPLHHSFLSAKKISFWQKKAVEWESLLHTSPGNQKRIKMKKNPINGLWPLAHGHTTTVSNINKACVFEEIWTDCPWITDFFMAQKKKVIPINNNFRRITKTDPYPRLMVLTRSSLHCENELAGLVKSLDQGMYEELVVYFDNPEKSSTIRLVVNRADRYKFWKNCQEKLHAFLNTTHDQKSWP